MEDHKEFEPLDARYVKIRDLFLKRREELGLNQRQMAVRSGVSQSYISFVERSGSMNGKAIEFFKMLHGYGIDPKEILDILRL